jgi:hypothetical protein
VFSTASVAKLSAKLLQLIAASVTRLTIFKSVVYLKTCAVNIIKEDVKLLVTETASVTGVECTNLETILSLVIVAKCVFVVVIS